MYFYWGSHRSRQKCHMDFGGPVAVSASLRRNNAVLHALYPLLSLITELSESIHLKAKGQQQ